MSLIDWFDTLGWVIFLCGCLNMSLLGPPERQCQTTSHAVLWQCGCSRHRVTSLFVLAFHWANSLSET